MEMVALGLVALVVGFFCGCTSIGGILLIPGIVLFTSLGIHEAMGTALFSFAIMAVLGTYLHGRRGSIRLREALALSLGALVSGYFGALANASFSASLLNILLAVLVFFSGISALRSGQKARWSVAGLPAGQQTVALAVLGLFVGFMCGLTGIGGPILSVPLMLAMGYAPLMSVAIAQPMQLLAGISGSVAFILGGVIDYTIAAYVTVVELAGFYLGILVAYRMEADKLKKAIAWLCLLTGVYLIFR